MKKTLLRNSQQKFDERELTNCMRKGFLADFYWGVGGEEAKTDAINNEISVCVCVLRETNQQYV